MPVNKESYLVLNNQLKEKNVCLVAVSKTKPVEDIQALYDLGQRDFGENYVQELVEKEAALPKDIRWHFIGHLQRNKVKYIAPFVHLIHGVDSYKLLEEINSQALKCNRIIDCLLQMHIAIETTKFGFNEEELVNILKTVPKYQQLNTMKNVRVIGLMGMASFSENKDLIRSEFRNLKKIFDSNVALSTINFQLSTLSMGMSGDYTIAIEEGSNMVRIGSLLFGERNYTH
ncbi:YggS family pyridoxal phosphate enzyme [Ferruginibacter profundus]